MTASSNEIAGLFRLDGRVAFVSGATGLLGRPMATALCAAGAHVILNSRSKDKLEVLASELQDAGYSASVACFDISDDAARRSFAVDTAKQYKQLDVIVNNASAGRTGAIESATPEDFDQVYRINVVAAFSLVQQTLPLLRASGRNSPGGASVINIASMYGSVSPNPSIYGTSGANNPPSYGSAKAGMIQLTRYLACHLAPDRIRVNCISPGPFPDKRYMENDPQFRSRLEEKVPLKRIGTPDELRGPILFLASPSSSYITGANLAVDGGWTAW